MRLRGATTAHVSQPFFLHSLDFYGSASMPCIVDMFPTCKDHISGLVSLHISSYICRWLFILVMMYIKSLVGFCRMWLGMWALASICIVARVSTAGTPEILTPKSWIKLDYCPNGCWVVWPAMLHLPSRRMQLPVPGISMARKGEQPITISHDRQPMWNIIEHS